jgi:hypothetical protein
MGMSVNSEWVSVGVGYTLASGRLFAPMNEFQLFCERLLNRPILTHEFADEATWAELREKFETEITIRIQATAAT